MYLYCLFVSHDLIPWTLDSCWDLNPRKLIYTNILITVCFIVNILFQEKWSRFFSEVSPSRYLGRTEDFEANAKPIYEVCDSKSEKSGPMYCFEGTPLRYSAFAWIVRLTNNIPTLLCSVAFQPEMAPNVHLLSSL